MLPFTNFSVAQVIVMIFLIKNVFCYRTVKQECLHQINLYFPDKITTRDCIEHAIANITYNMPEWGMNIYAYQYYCELMNHLKKGKIEDPNSYWTSALKPVKNPEHLKNIRNAIGELSDTFGADPEEIVRYAYARETLNENDSSFKYRYMNHIIEFFEIDDKGLNLYPSNYCEKEEAEQTCRYQIDFVFKACSNANECIKYAMICLRENSFDLSKNDHAKGYYNSLKRGLVEDTFLGSIEIPAKFFSNFVASTSNKKVHEKSLESIEEVRSIAGDNKLAFVIHTYENEIWDQYDLSYTQLYVQHIFQQCTSHTFQTIFSPEDYCKTVRENTNE